MELPELPPGYEWEESNSGDGAIFLASRSRPESGVAGTPYLAFWVAEENRVRAKRSEYCADMPKKEALEWLAQLAWLGEI